MTVVTPAEATSTSEEPVSSSTSNGTDTEQTNKDEIQNQEEVVPPVSITADVEIPASKLTRIEEEPEQDSTR